MNNKYLDFTGLSTYDQKIKEYIGAHGTPVDKTLTQEDEAADAKVTGEAVEEVKGAAISGTYDIDFAEYENTVVPYTINSSNKTTKSGSSYSAYQIPRDASYNNITITAQSDHVAMLLFLKEQLSSTLASGTDVASALATGETKRHSVTAGTSESFVLPDDCTYIFIFKISASVNIVPTALYYFTDIKKDLDDLTATTEVETAALKNAIKDMLSEKVTPKLRMATFDGVEDIPVSEINCDILPQQSGEGDPSAINVRPFIGFEKIDISHTGKNIYGGSYLYNTLKNSSAEYDHNDALQTVQIRGNDVNISERVATTFKDNTQYTIILKAARLNGTQTGTNLRFIYTDGTYNTIGFSGSTFPQTIVKTSDAAKTIAYIGYQNYTGNGRVEIYCNESGVFEGAVTAADFEAYRGETQSLNMPSEIYGGNLVCSNGEWGINYYAHYATYNGETLTGEWMSSMDVYDPETPTSPTVGAEVVDLGATTFVSLSGTEIDAYSGINNIFADMGSISAVYYGAESNSQFDPSKDSPYAVSVAEHISAMSNGHVKYYEGLSGTPMDVYNSSYEISGSVDGSQYIRLRSTDLVNILIGYNAKLSFNNSEFYIYFYDMNGNVVWDVFDYTNPVTGEKNRITAPNLKAINGFQFKNVPEGYYIRVAMVNDCKLKLAIWDGAKFGIPLGAYSTVYNSSYQKVSLPEDGSACIALPKYGSYIIAKPGYTFLRGMTSVGSSSSYKDPIPEAFFPAQVVRLTGMKGSGRPKNIVIVKDYNYTDGTYSKDVLAGDVSDYVAVLDNENTFFMEKPVCYAHRVVLDKAEALTRKFAWTPVANVEDSGGTNLFKAGCTYHGVPYRSTWSYPMYVGWHVTKHTFINASLDPDSIFYNGSPNNHPGPYYALVCSSFGTLVAGFDYPMTNFGLMKDPNTDWIKTKQPMVGGLFTNGYSHCVVPIERYNSAENDHFALKIVEEGSPYSRAKVVFDDVITSWDGIGSNSTYMDFYQVMCYPNKHDHNYLAPYDIESSSFRTDTTAKPYKGDRCVYTSQYDVKINIKDATANRLYYQKFNATVSNGVLTSATPTGDPAYITFEPGTTQVILRSKTGDGGTYTGADLEDNEIYGVWTSLDDAQTTVPTVVESSKTVYVVEYFEWHDITLNPITYTVENGILKTDDEFWYCVAMGYNYADPYQPDKRSGLVSIPYEAPKKSMDGSTTAEHSDYSKYGERFCLKSVDDVRTFFRKGRLGAYTVEFNADSPEPDDSTP